MEKKALIINVYRLLYDRSCYEKPLTFIDMVDIFKKEYGFEVSRKTVASCVEILSDNGFDIAKGKVKGVYLANRSLEEGEIKFLIDCVCSFCYIDANYSAELIKKLCALGGKTFEDKYKTAYKVQNLQRGTNKDIFYNVEVLDEAISSGKKVRFDYNKFNFEKVLTKTNTHTVSPFYTFMVNQCYYLMGASSVFNDVGFFRIDKITNVEIIDEQSQKITEFENYKNGLDLDKLFHSYPYMYADKLEMIEILCDKSVLDDIITRFGMGVKIKRNGEDYKVSFMASVKAMEFYAMQYGTKIKVLAPEKLVQTVKENIKIMAGKYEN